MTPTTGIATYGAILSTVVAILSTRKWLLTGPRLVLTVMGRALIFGDEVNAEEYVAVTVVNRGDLATTITNMTVHQYRSIFHRWYRKAFWSAIVKEPGAITGREPPYVLSPGTQWMGIVPYNGDLLERVKLGNLFVAIHATHVGRSVAKRVIWKPDSRDNLPQSED